MKTYSIYDAKAKLSELLRFVKANGPVVITERGKPIAQVVPYQVVNEASLETRLQQLEEYGLLKRRSESYEKFKPLAKKPGALKRFLESRD
ncbi:MAG: hypothetical protein COV44_03070 [Deltaproteobacteria bacterium CG11_big_fil_rev_8_21_14_0_20_45_16]|nr:MAG: hypothetical protein COV44_03070 [Deltaproteobacteria bacterium CG11_big_fil_rev_8_21_14_0_20_45_16]